MRLTFSKNSKASWKLETHIGENHSGHVGRLSSVLGRVERLISEHRYPMGPDEP